MATTSTYHFLKSSLFPFSPTYTSSHLLAFWIHCIPRMRIHPSLDYNMFQPLFLEYILEQSNHGILDVGPDIQLHGRIVSPYEYDDYMMLHVMMVCCGGHWRPYTRHTMKRAWSGAQTTTGRIESPLAPRLSP